MTNTISRLNQEMQSSVATALKNVLSESFSLYFKTHSFHWNVEGAHFHGFHQLFETQYTEMWHALDEIAERLRAIGYYAPINIHEMIEAGGISETNEIPDALEMINILIKDHERLIETMKTGLVATENADDESTSDLLVGRITVHEKALWMLKSIAKK